MISGPRPTEHDRANKYTLSRSKGWLWVAEPRALVSDSPVECDACIVCAMCSKTRDTPSTTCQWVCITVIDILCLNLLYS